LYRRKWLEMLLNSLKSGKMAQKKRKNATWLIAKGGGNMLVPLKSYAERQA